MNERSITHKLAEHLRSVFPAWDVDCEYNRRHDDPKRLQISRKDVCSDDLHASTVFPEVIVHKRGSDQNFIVIEVKKSTNPESEERDLKKLNAFKAELGYELAIFLKIACGPGASSFKLQLCDTGSSAAFSKPGT